MRSCLVIPHHLSTLDFLNEWQQEIEQNDIFVIIVEDKSKRETTLPDWFDVERYEIYTHKDIDADLGKNSWIISRRSSAIRAYGFYKAWEMGFEYIYTLDNDCMPDSPAYFFQHKNNLETFVTQGWVRSWQDFIPSRGFPFDIRNKSEVVISHGLWSNVPDLDAPTYLLNPMIGVDRPLSERQIMPRYNYFPMCGMNLAFKRSVASIMYFGLQGPEWPFDRFDDIWAGIIAKKIIDHLGLAVISGEPFVEHRKQSNVYDNLIKEAPGIKVNEYFWKIIDKIELKSNSPLECYKEIALKMQFDDEYTDYWKKLKEAMLIWSDLFI